MSAGGRGSCRGRQSSRRAARGDNVGETGTQASGTIGSIRRREDLPGVRCEDNNPGFEEDGSETSLHRGLLLADVHVDEKLEPLGSRRRRAPIILILFVIK